MTSDSRALVVARYGNTVLLQRDDLSTMKAAARRKHEHIACGDSVKYSVNDQGEAIVSSIAPRKNALQRTDFRGRTKTLACNIDQMVILASSRPATDWELIDQMIVTAVNMDIEILIAAHKSDLDHPQDWTHELTYFERIGHPVVHSSTKDPNGLDDLESRLINKTNILVGQSGMGKSSLTRRLIDDTSIDREKIAVNELSPAADLGQHTTTVSRSYPLAGGGHLIDSPGIRDFTPPELPRDRIAPGFIEIFDASHDCRFSNCLHQKEPNCAVHAAVEDQTISRRRYESYTGQLLGHAE